MQSFWLGVIGNIITALIIAVIPILLVFARVGSLQRELAAFFGLNSGARRVQVVLSSYLPVRAEETLASGARSKGWTDETVSVDEFRGAQAIAGLFRKSWTLPSMASIVDALTGGGRGFGIVSVDFEPYTKQLSWNLSDTFVVMGTGAKESNAFASRFLGEDSDSEHSVFRFAKDPMRGRAFELLPVRGYQQRYFFADEYEVGDPKKELAVLQRITLPDKKVVFLCAGKNSPATTMVAQYLADNWRSLFTRYRNQSNGDFAHLYLFSQESPSAPRLLMSVF